MRNIDKKREKEKLVCELTDFLPILRAALRISQGELAEKVGISRQTYCALEIKKRQMNWNTFLSLFLFFTSNAATNQLLTTKGNFLDEVYELMNYQHN